MANGYVYIEDLNGSPRIWKADSEQIKGMKPITCYVCGSPATEVDRYHPIHKNFNRCAVHSVCGNE